MYSPSCEEVLENKLPIYIEVKRDESHDLHDNATTNLSV